MRSHFFLGAGKKKQVQTEFSSHQFSVSVMIQTFNTDGATELR